VFLDAFERARVTPQEWNHRAHIRVAFLLLRALPFDAAVARLRAGIQRVNRAHGVVDELTVGYHETLTVAWARLTLAALHDVEPDESFARFVEGHPELLDRARIGAHYSSARIRTWRAKRTFVEPDLAALTPLASPGAGGGGIV